MATQIQIVGIFAVVASTNSDLRITCKTNLMQKLQNIRGASRK